MLGFGEEQPSFDRNRNGAQDNGEVGYAGATLTLSGTPSRTATTDAAGGYSFAVPQPGPPTYDFEIWLASALLSVTFPLLIFYAEIFKFWPLRTTVPSLLRK